ncbi:MAG: cation:proton antiporter [Vulcanimicrobiota bacterium]
MHGPPVKAVLLVIGLMLVAAVGSSKALGGSRFLSVRLLARTGILFLLLGAVIGPNGLRLLDPDVLEQLGPIVVLGLGWIGFLYGIHLEYRWLRRFASGLFLTALGESAFTFLTVLVVFWALGQGANLPALLILASAAAGTAPAALFVLRSQLPSRGPAYELLRFCACLDDLPGLLALGILFSFSHGKGNGLMAVGWFVLQVGVGVIGGVLTHWLHELVAGPEGGDPGAFSLAFFGVVGLTSGFASYLGLSPLFVNVVSGITFANVSFHSEMVFAGLARREHTVYVIFLLLAGCYWPFNGFTAFGMLALYIGARLLGKVAGSYLCANTFLRGPQFNMMSRVPPYFGLGLLPQGGLAIAMVMSYLWAFRGTAQAWAVNVVHLSVILNELVTPYLLFVILRGIDEE